MERHNVTEDDEGKRVVNSTGDTVGMVSEVRSGTAYVDPDPGIGEKVLSKLGWEDADAEDYPLDSSSIDVITDDEIRLARDL